VSRPRKIFVNPNAAIGRSVHYKIRRLEAERIDLENSKLMERIVCSTGTINFYRLDNSY